MRRWPARAAGLAPIVSLLAIPAPAPAELAPACHRHVLTICGVTATSALELKGRIERSGLPSRQYGEFSLFEELSPNDTVLRWAVAREGEPAYPAVACSETHRAADGAWTREREMRCDAAGSACSALFLAFSDVERRIDPASGARTARP